jgi:DNA modification methylase
MTPYYQSDKTAIYLGDCMEVLATLPENSVHCCITSPPYYGLRDYGVDGQLGLERTPEEYVEKMVGVFREVWRVLRDDGTVWLNLGDSYASSGVSRNGLSNSAIGSGPGGACKQRGISGLKYNVPSGIKPKDLIGIPWRVAFALQSAGWYLRQDIIWHKPNPMPESVTDRCTKAHEYIFLLTKNARYFYDAEAVKETAASSDRRQPTPEEKTVSPNGNTPWLNNKYARGSSGYGVSETGRNRRSVWTITTRPFTGAHFAVFPPKLIEPCILAGTSEKGCCGVCGAPWVRVVEKTAYKPEIVCAGVRAVDASRQDKTRKISGKEYNEQARVSTTGWQPTCTCAAETTPCTVLDPFVGSGTTGVVSLEHGRHFTGIELNPEYLKMAQSRITGIEGQPRQISLFDTTL